jgi:hypothetical protein
MAAIACFFFLWSDVFESERKGGWVAKTHLQVNIIRLPIEF